MSPPSAAIALRESFGDRKLPDITRKITACVSCRKLKIKCHMNGNKPPCSRCKARGLSCTVNKSLQILLESDASWKEKMEQRVDTLEKALMHGASQKASSDADYATTTTSCNNNAFGASRSDFAAVNRALETPSMVTLNLSCSLGAFPASSMINITLTDERAYTGYNKPDLISCDIISLEAAEGFFAFYQQDLDPCIHHVLSHNDTLASLRARSPLLTAAICTVAAFCGGSKCYQPCLDYLTNQVSGKMFSSKYTFDDVRALCIGAYWLNEVSSALNGLAVRIASELDLHRCITKMPHIKDLCYNRTRLYFLVYLCDHHCSLSHGRPPLTRDFHSLKSPGVFLQSKFSTPADIKLISQVELWSITGRVFDLFGADIESSVASQRSTELARLSNDYGRWRQDWLGVLSSLKHGSSLLDKFSERVFNLYFHSAKLYLFSHVFRGPSSQEEEEGEGGFVDNDDYVSSESSFAHSALESALSIIRCIVDGNDDEAQSQPWLEKLPLYFGTMIAFASVCLIRIPSHQRQMISDAKKMEISACLHRLVEVLDTSLMVDHPTHPLPSIAKSLRVATSEQQQQLPGANEHSSRDYDEPFDFDMFADDAVNMSLFRDQDQWLSFPGL